MRYMFIPALALGMAMSSAAFAQSSPPANPQAGQQASGPSSQQLLTAQKLRQDLEKVGFTDVNVVAESFVVRAKTKDGDPVLMTIGPHGMTVFETAASTSGNSASSTTGSTTSSGSSSSGSATKK